MACAIEANAEPGTARKQDSAGAGAWMVYVALATDLIGDGLLIGSGAAVSGQLAVVVAIGQVLADVPAGSRSSPTFATRA